MFYWINPTSLTNSYVLVAERMPQVWTGKTHEEGNKFHLLYSTVIANNMSYSFYPEAFHHADPNNLLAVKMDDLTELTTRNQQHNQLLICIREWTVRVH